MKIDYDHNANHHTLSGASAALPHILEGRRVESLLDVGCGTGTWVRAAIDYGIADVCGIDGVNVSDADLLFPRAFFRQEDLTKRCDLGRKFDIVLCLEVGEHLMPEVAATLVQSLTAHSDVVVFSGACPGQIGQHHVNCQWPEYWQRLFNAQGYACDDGVRWRIWDIAEIEPWYRQSIFVATRAENHAGREPKIRPVIHPDMLAIRGFEVFEDERRRNFTLIEQGNQAARWYLATAYQACAAKLKRKLSRTFRK